jgi:hypothetical protein
VHISATKRSANTANHLGVRHNSRLASKHTLIGQSAGSSEEQRIGGQLASIFPLCVHMMLA